MVKAMVFPRVMYGCESWNIKIAEYQRIDAFKLWFWRRFLRVPWTARRSNQLILKEINPEYSLEGVMLKLKFQYFGHLMGRANSLEKTWCWERLKAGGEGRWDGWRASLTQWTWVWANSRDGEWQGSHAAVHEDAKSQTWLSGWTTIYFFLNHTMEASRIYPIGLVIIASILRENTWTQWQCLQNKCLAAY